MDIGKQKQLVIRVQADLRKEAAKHRFDGCAVSSCDCEDQAEALESIIESLTTLAQVVAAAQLLRGLAK